MFYGQTRVDICYSHESWLYRNLYIVTWFVNVTVVNGNGLSCMTSAFIS